MPTTYRVMDTDVQVPMTVERSIAGLTAVSADPGAIAAALPDDLVPLRLPGGRGLVLLLVVDYVANPLGDYDEVVVGLAAQPRRAARVPALRRAGDLLRGRFGVWIQHMAVNQAFTQEAGRTIWGYPKTLDELAFRHDGATATCAWARDGQDVLRVRQPTAGSLPAPAMTVSTYTRIGPTTMRTALRATARGVGVTRDGATIELGAHPLADELRTFGLGGRPLVNAWMSDVHMRFDTARPLRSG